MAEVMENVKWMGWKVGVLSVGAPHPNEMTSQPLPSSIILVGTGNPGICSIYRDFAVSLHKKSQLPVWVLGLVGFDDHEFVDVEKVDLNTQVQMKKDFIMKYLSGVRVICVDHSTSCFIHLKLLQDPRISPLIETGYLLMPVLTVPDGPVWQLLNYGMRTKFFDVAEKVMSAFEHIPMKPKKTIVDNFYRLMLCRRPPDLQYFTSTIIQLYFRHARLLFDEAFDPSLLDRFLDRINIYCSTTDCLLHSKIKAFARNSQRARFGNVPHGFFVDDSENFGEYVGEWILKNRGDTNTLSSSPLVTEEEFGPRCRKVAQCEPCRCITGFPTNSV